MEIDFELIEHASLAVGLDDRQAQVKRALQFIMQNLKFKMH
jgi:hypothetical protein